MISGNGLSAQVGIALGVIGGSALLDQAGDELNDSINQARAAGSALLKQADELGKQRLDQIDGILSRTIGDLVGKSEEAALKIIAQAVKDVDALREQAFSDLNEAIWNVECATKRLLLEDAKDTLGKAGEWLNTHRIKVTPPIEVEPTDCRFLGYWCKDPTVFEITQPFGNTYTAIRDLMETSIAAKNIDDDTPAHYIVDTYEYISSFALKTSCFYPGGSEAWNREHAIYMEKAKQWRNVLIIKPVQ